MINLTIEPLNLFFLEKGWVRSINYYYYYLKRVYVGEFSHWSEQKL